jgi:hypothetical protein
MTNFNGLTKIKINHRYNMLEQILSLHKDF